MEEESGGGKVPIDGERTSRESGVLEQINPVFKPKSCLMRTPDKREQNTDHGVSSSMNQLDGASAGGSRDLSGENNATLGTNRTVVKNADLVGMNSIVPASDSEVFGGAGEGPTNAYIMLMKNRQRPRTISAPAEPEDGSGKRKMEVSPAADGGNSKKSKNELYNMEKFGNLLEALEAQISTHPTIKKDIKIKMKEVSAYFDKLKKQQNSEAMKQKLKALSEKEQSKIKLINEIQEAGKADQIRTLVAKIWPSDVYERTRISNNNTGVAEEETVLSVLVRPESFQADKNFIALKNVVPAIGEVTEEKLRDLGCIRIARQELISIPGVKNYNRRIHTLIYGTVLSEVGDLEVADALNWADEVKAYAESAKKRTVVIRAPEDVHLEKIRKVFECRFHGSETIVYIVPNGDGKAKRKEPDKEGILIEGLGDSYAEVLKKLRTGVNQEECGAHVRRVEQTPSGGARLVIVEHEKGGSDKIKQKISELIPNQCTLKNIKAVKAIVIKDIGVDVDREEVVGAISEQFDIPPEDVKINEFRGEYRGYKNVTAFIPSNRLRDVVNARRIRIGWYSCRAIERVEPDYCFNCERIGHTAVVCKAPRQRKRCHNCGSQEHLFKDCQEEAACYTCNAKGHRVKSMACPVYRDLVKKKRLANV